MNVAAFTQLFITEQQPGVWLITLNRPKALNALNRQVLEQLASAVAWIENQPDARVLLINGSGDKAFAAGADIVEMKDLNAQEAREFSQVGMATMHRIENSRLPVIALVNGFCLGGGCELAMACDFILAADNAVFGQPEVTLGVPPGFGGSQRLPRRVGPGMAAQLLMTGEKVKADEALRIGLCNQVLPAAQLLERGVEMAVAIAKNAPLAVSHCKRLVQVSGDQSIENGCRMESDLFGLSFASEDQKEGMGAFTERRKAEFTGQ